MTQQRALLDGPAYLLTAALRRPGRDDLIAHVDLLRAAWRQTAHARPFQCFAVVILPDQVQAVWAMPPADDDPALRWGLIARGFAEGLARRTGIAPARLWRPLHVRPLSGADTRNQAVADVLLSPVRAGLVPRAEDWLLSSVHRDLRQGLHLSAAA
jgi:putative transposase